MNTQPSCYFILVLTIFLSGNLWAQQENTRNTQSDARNRARIHSELGSAYFQAGNPAIALEELQAALESDPAYYPAYSIRGLVQASLKENAKAEDDFKKAMALAPGDPEVNNNYGWYLCETGRPKQSIAYFLQALKSPLYETPERAYTNAGSCALKAGDSDEALGYLLKALQFSRDGGLLPRLMLTRLFFQQGRLGEAKAYLGDVMKLMEPPSAEILWLGIRLERKLGNRLMESSYVAQLRSRHPTSAEYQEFLKGNFE